jgi:hypothetical protein
MGVHIRPERRRGWHQTRNLESQTPPFGDAGMPSVPVNPSGHDSCRDQQDRALAGRGCCGCCGCPPSCLRPKRPTYPVIHPAVPPLTKQHVLRAQQPPVTRAVKGPCQGGEEGNEASEYWANVREWNDGEYNHGENALSSTRPQARSAACLVVQSQMIAPCRKSTNGWDSPTVEVDESFFDLPNCPW